MSGALSSTGRLFQTRGSWTAKLRSPYFVLVLGTTSCLVCAERRWRRPVHVDVGSQYDCRYCGVAPCWHLYARTAVVYDGGIVSLSRLCMHSKHILESIRQLLTKLTTLLHRVMQTNASVLGRDSRKSRKHSNHGNRDFRQMPRFCQNTVFAVFFGQNVFAIIFWFLISVSWSFFVWF